jgi:MoxR-like ATPase
MKLYQSDVEAVDALHLSYKSIRKEISQVIIGQDDVVKSVLISIFSNSHCLLVGVPGLAKTLLVQTVAQVLDLSYNRIQFTPDLMPSDIIGSEILGEDRSFKFIRGPIFSNIILADEINRTPPKTQAALLEAMQEKVVTVGGQAHRLPQPFFVLATQNPIEQEGTYPLPEAQLDRFLFKVKVSYPSQSEEKIMMDRMTSNDSPKTQKICNPEDILAARRLCNEIYMDEKVKDYILNIIFASRFPEKFNLSEIKRYISVGASPRATLSLVKASRANAFIRHRGYVTPEDVKSVAYDILRHRILLTYEADAENISSEQIISRILDRIEVP